MEKRLCETAKSEMNPEQNGTKRSFGVVNGTCEWNKRWKLRKSRSASATYAECTSEMANILLTERSRSTKSRQEQAKACEDEQTTSVSVGSFEERSLIMTRGRA